MVDWACRELKRRKIPRRLDKVQFWECHDPLSRMMVNCLNAARRAAVGDNKAIAKAFKDLKVTIKAPVELWHDVVLVTSTARALLEIKNRSERAELADVIFGKRLSKKAMVVLPELTKLAVDEARLILDQHFGCTSESLIAEVFLNAAWALDWMKKGHIRNAVYCTQAAEASYFQALANDNWATKFWIGHHQQKFGGVNSRRRWESSEQSRSDSNKEVTARVEAEMNEAGLGTWKAAGVVAGQRMHDGRSAALTQRAVYNVILDHAPWLIRRRQKVTRRPDR
jgi:hypothetical protein